MKRTLLAIAVILTAFVPTLRAAVSATAYNSGTPFVIINGVLCESASAWSGGGIGTTVGLGIAGTNGVRSKHVTNTVYDAVMIESNLPFNSALAALFNSLCTGTPPNASITLGQLNHNLVPVGTTLECVDAQLVEVRFPEVSAADTKSPIKATFVFRVAQVRFIATPASVPAASATQPNAARGYSLDLPGLDGTRITRVGEIRISRIPATDQAGETRDYLKTPGPTEYANVKISIAASADTTWPAWRDDFLVMGNSADANEKTGTLTFVGQTGTPVYSLQLLHAGLVHFSVIPADNDRPSHSEVELYVEQIKPAVAPAPTATPLTTGSTGAKPMTETKLSAKPDASTPTETKKKPDAAADPAKATRGSTATNETKPVDSGTASGAAGATDPVASKQPEPAVATPLSRREGVKFALVKHPDDKGPRDPAGSPRPEGTVRKNYMMNKGKGYSQELASYTTAQSMDELEAFFDKALTSDGWVEESRMENNNALNHAHQLQIKYVKSKDVYSVTYTDVKPGEVTIDLRIDRVL